MATTSTNIAPTMTTTQATAPVKISEGAGVSTMVRDRIRGMDNYSTRKSTVKMALALDIQLRDRHRF
jgi:hypothetical protein